MILIVAVFSGAGLLRLKRLHLFGHRSISTIILVSKSTRKLVTVGTKRESVCGWPLVKRIVAVTIGVGLAAR
jgi:hypothetical protein